MDAHLDTPRLAKLVAGLRAVLPDRKRPDELTTSQKEALMALMR